MAEQGEQEKRIKLILDAKDKWIRRALSAEAHLERCQEALREIADFHEWSDGRNGSPHFISAKAKRIAREAVSTESNQSGSEDSVTSERTP